MIGIGMIALAMALAFSAWCQRDAKLAKITDKRARRQAQVDRAERLYHRMASMMSRWSDVAGAPPPPFPERGDNVETLPTADVIQFGKKPRTDTQPDGAA